MSIKETVAKIVDTFVGREGRKVAFGIWLFWVATALLVKALITSQIWWWCALAAALLIGFGTIADKIMEKIGDSIAGGITARIAPAVTTKTEVTVTP